MAKILVYNQDTNRMETFFRGENEAMPYNTNNPRNAFYISRNDGLFSNLVNHQKDTLINANSLVMLGRRVYDENDKANIARIKAKWNHIN